MELLGSRLALSNAVSGAAADTFSSVCTYPVDAVKTQMQAHSDRSLTDVLEHIAEHPSEAYKGIQTKIVHGVIQKFQYFYSYALLKQLYTKRFGTKPSASMDLLIGYLSALAGLATTMPLEVINTRIVTSIKAHKDEKQPGFWHTFKEVLEHEGALSFYRTLPASMILCINPAITFVAFEEIKSYVLKRFGNGSEFLTTLQALVVGIISKSIATIVTFPFIRAKVLMSVWKKAHERHLQAERERGIEPTPEELSRETPGLMATMQAVVENEGIQGLYKGLSPQLFKGVTNAGIMLASKEKIYVIVKGVIMGGDAVAASE
ncbi:Mitochondrial substrate carrier family protein Q [Hondaea fermentalgiana]|uniref:Mitochondrial substrate carrier family protein Q n=1 Tax=Hondaea fermentalgiana TaxID=2315210 RepID=A0A2R5G2I2_9STRA|nr:Mitochondrial substrate carrier family protein Q [Hondaea fermentalgiana]|eukprot:GBG24529.1 Mitochondrial substrate carrier family protein Q [Hondaea fermentalgiana]